MRGAPAPPRSGGRHARSGCVRPRRGSRRRGRLATAGPARPVRGDRGGGGDRHRGRDPAVRHGARDGAHAGTRGRRSLRRDRVRRRRRGRWLDPVDGRSARGDGTSRPVDPDRDVGARRPVRRRSGMDRCRTTGSRSDGRRRRAGHLRRRRHRPARERRSHRVGTGWQESGLRPQRTDRTRRVRAGEDPSGDRPHREGRVGARRSGVLRAHPVAQPEPGRDVLQRRLGRSAERVPDRHGRRPASDVRRRGDALRLGAGGVPASTRCLPTDLERCLARGRHDARLEGGRWPGDRGRRGARPRGRSDPRMVRRRCSGRLGRNDRSALGCLRPVRGFRQRDLACRGT